MRPSGRPRSRGPRSSVPSETGLVRNAALVLGSRRLPEAVPALAERLDDHQESPVVRASAAWALGRIATEPARAALEQHRDDDEPLVTEAVARALAEKAHGSRK